MVVDEGIMRGPSLLRTLRVPLLGGAVFLTPPRLVCSYKNNCFTRHIFPLLARKIDLVFGSYSPRRYCPTKV